VPVGYPRAAARVPLTATVTGMSNVARRRAAALLLLSSALAALTGALALRLRAGEFRATADRAHGGVEFGPIIVDTLAAQYRLVTLSAVVIGGMLLCASVLAALVPDVGRTVAWLLAPIAVVVGALPAIYGCGIVLASFDIEVPADDEIAARARLRSDLSWLGGGRWHAAVVAAGWIVAL
jgi:hypothetical protein